MRLIPIAGIVILVIVFAVACQSESLPTAYPTYTPYPTYTLYPTYTPLSPVNRRPSAEVEALVWPTGPRDDVIPFEDAADFVGEKVTVEGTVIRTHNSGNVVFLNFSADIGNFTAVIFPDDWPKFPSPPENLFYGKLVRIEGVIEEYQGAPEIIIRDPWQIEVALTLGQPLVADCNCPSEALPQEQTPATSDLASTAESTPTSPSPSIQETAVPSSEAIVISWEEAADYEGQTVTIAGHIVDTYNSGKVVFLNFDKDFSETFKVVIFPDAWPLFPAPPEDYYRDKTIQVTGQVEMYQNAPEIIVERPDQIEIME
jgi:DNA/RNA endonuclease YhcR with UshA esterase domain